MPARILLFDLGGVLVDLGDPVGEMDLPLSNEQFWKLWLSSPLVHKFETGQSRCCRTPMRSTGSTC